MHQHPANQAIHDNRSLGDRLADAVARNFGSWRFLIIKTVLVIIWMTYNVLARMLGGGHGWLIVFDPYPFILLNLAFSIQASYAAPIILLSQNRQSEHDRLRAEDDHARMQTIEKLLRLILRVVIRIARQRGIDVPEEG